MHDLARVGRQLHNRYEASCSYAWACTKRYEARTDRLEAAAQALAAAVNVRSELQRDPRGWPPILQLAGVRPVKTLAKSVGTVELLLQHFGVDDKLPALTCVAGYKPGYLLGG